MKVSKTRRDMYETVSECNGEKLRKKKTNKNMLRKLTPKKSCVSSFIFTLQTA